MGVVASVQQPCSMVATGLIKCPSFQVLEDVHDGSPEKELAQLPLTVQFPRAQLAEGVAC